MAEKPVAPGQEVTPPPQDETPAQTREDFRLACRRYSRMRSRMPR
jgi:hypothetical protein